MRVLVVEDDRSLGLFVQKGLQIEGHEVDWVGDGEAALRYAEEHPPDLMVLDLSLPRCDGTEVLEAVRGKYKDMAVLVLTGRTDTDGLVKCLNLGADDYLVKPFSFHELTARCRAILRRTENVADPVLRHGGIELQRLERKVTCDGQPLELTAKEYALLEYLVQRHGQCCSRSELLREVWQTTPEHGTNIVDVYINYLRRKLTVAQKGKEACSTVIETVRGKGYRIKIPIDAAKPAASERLMLPAPLQLPLLA